MNNDSNIKIHRRRRFEVPIIIRDYNSGSSINARMYRRKKNSILFKTDHALQLGSDIYIHLEYPLSDDTAYETKEIICRARVSWCRPASDSSYCEVEAMFCELLIHQLQKQDISNNPLGGLWEQESTDFS